MSDDDPETEAGEEFDYGPEDTGGAPGGTGDGGTEFSLNEASEYTTSETEQDTESESESEADVITDGP